MKTIPASELILNTDGSVFHLHLLPGQLADRVILVGDPARVDAVASYFDERECDVRDEVGAVDDRLRHEVEAVRTEKHAGDYVSRDVRELQELCYSGHREPADEYERDGYDDGSGAGSAKRRVSDGFEH